jgi:hypothetical protein
MEMGFTLREADKIIIDWFLVQGIIGMPVKV